MEKRTKIIIGVASALAIGAGVWYFFWRKNNMSSVTTIEVPPSYANNPLVVSTKSKTNYILGTLDTMQLKNGVIVNKKTGSPIVIGLLQGIWRMHTEELERLKDVVDKSNEPSDVKNVAYRLIENATHNNVQMFDPKEYSYQAQWYKDYLKRI
jgi:hypothetical protein